MSPFCLEVDGRQFVMRPGRDQPVGGERLALRCFPFRRTRVKPSGGESRFSSAASAPVFTKATANLRSRHAPRRPETAFTEVSQNDSARAPEARLYWITRMPL